MSVQEHFEERAGIMQLDGLMTREEAERLAKLDSEEYRHACEVRTVASMPSINDRREYLDDVDKKRGKEAGSQLRESVQKEWLRRKA